MSNLFLVLVLLSLLSLVAGLIKPAWFNKLFKGNATRIKTGLTFLGAMIAFFILFGVTAPKSNNTVANQASQNSPVQVASNNQTSTSSQQQNKVAPAPVQSQTVAPKQSSVPKNPAPVQQNQNPQTQQPVTSATPQPAPAPTPAPAPASPSPITLSGNSQQATQQFTLDQGLSIFTLHNSGSSNFIVDLLDTNGSEVANLSNAIGNFSGSQALSIKNVGSYLLNIQSDGSWNITITQPRVNSAGSVSNLSGVGNQATQFFNLSSGLHTFKLTNSGNGNFIVDLLDRNGNEVDNLENVIGNFNGSTAVHIGSSGPYLLNIQSGSGSDSGNWTIVIQ